MQLKELIDDYLDEYYDDSRTTPSHTVFYYPCNSSDCGLYSEEHIKLECRLNIRLRSDVSYALRYNYLYKYLRPVN